MKRIVPFFAAAILFQGCAIGQTKPTTAGSCNSADACTVTVTVAGCSGKEISAEPDVLKVKRGYKGNITWKLAAPPKWAFAKNGIVFKDAKATDFTSPKAGDRDFYWYDANTSAAAYQYTINLVSDSGKPCSKDPTIMNDQDP